MKLIIVRHGETIQNASKIIQGQIHGKLSDKGVAQAKKLGERFKNVQFDHLYSSDLGRCIETAEEILKFHPDLNMKKDKRIRERFFGSVQGKRTPPNWDWENLPEDVETDKEICKRVESFLDELYSKHRGETVLVVCHGGVKRAFLTVIHNKPVSEFGTWEGLKNTSVSEFEIIENGKHKINLINCTSHLDSINTAAQRSDKY